MLQATGALHKKVKNKNMNLGAEIRVEALFTDYDGTLSPLNVPRRKSRVSAANMAVLREISQRIPVAVITTKDLSFVVGRTPFAHAWFGLGGLEMKIGDLTTRASCMERMRPYLAKALNYAKSVSNYDLVIEEKRDSSGTTVAFSVDWRMSKNKREAVKKALKILSYCESLPLVTIRNEDQLFFDVFPCPVDKGKAVQTLKRKLGVRKGVLYMGDSSVDNTAFEKADIGIGVIHEETPPNLACDYSVEFNDVGTFLQGLLRNSLRFNSKLPKVQNKSKAFRCIP